MNHKIKPLTALLFSITITHTMAEDFLFDTFSTREYNNALSQDSDASLYGKAFAHCLERENCPSLEIEYLQSSNARINEFINRNINKRYEINDSQIPDEKTYRKMLKAFSQSNSETSEVENFPSTESISLRYLGHYNDLELLEITHVVFPSGAAHESYSIDSYVLKNGKPLRFSELFNGEQTQTLTALAQKAYQQWQIDQGFPPDPSSEDNDDSISLTENFSFAPKGLELIYQPYEIAAYAFGAPRIVIPFEQLTGVLKDEYLPK